MHVFRTNFSAFLLCSFLSLAPALPAQQPEFRQLPGKAAQPAPLDTHKLIERRFESTHPLPRAKWGGAVPGSKLIEQHLLRGVRAGERAATLGQAESAATSPAVPPPGILLRPTLPAGAIPTAVVTGDFNRDGHMDYVVANGWTSDLWIYLGKGDGTFEAPRIVPLSKGLAPVYLVASDLRHIGKLDLVLAEADTSSIGVLLGNGDGTFGYERLWTLPEPPGALVAGDFNKDGKLDIAAVMDTVVTPGTLQVPYLALLEGDGKGGFSAPIITSNWGYYSTAWNLASADVNGDGLPDLLITGPGLENAQIYLNHGDGTFTAGQTILYNYEGMDAMLDGKLADVNGDHCPDAVIADQATMVWVAAGDCAGHFGTPQPVYMGDSPTSLQVMDINGDGHPDIVAATMPGIDPFYGMVGGNTLTVALGDGKGNFGISRQYVGAGQSLSVAAADFNGDGKPDFVTANSDTDTTTVYLNDGKGGFGFPQGVYAGVANQGTIDAPFSGLSFADLNHDGKVDAFFLDEGRNWELFTTSFLNDGTGHFSNPITSDTGVALLDNWMGDYRLGDFRNTGHPDLVAIGQNMAFSPSAQYILFLRGNGDGTFAKGTPVTTTGADGVLAVGDFNKDGKLDFAAISGSGSHLLTVFLGNGDGTFRAQPPLSFTDSALTPVRAYTGDFNKDGNLDILVFATNNGYFTTESTVWEFLGNGNGTFQPGRQVENHFQPIALADLNGDGRPDIARYDTFWPDGKTQTYGPARFTNYLDQLDGSFKQTSSYAPYAGTPANVWPYMQFGDPLALSLVTDLNGDGKQDEVGFQDLEGDYYAQILMGNGDGTMTPTYDVFPFYVHEYPAYSRDLDGDGKADMVQLVGASSSLQVLKGGKAPALQLALADEIVKRNASCGWVFPDLPSASDRAVTLSSSQQGVILPSSVTIPAKALSAKFCYTLAPNLAWRQVFDVRAQMSGETAVAWASQSYTQGFSLGLSTMKPPPLYPGQSTQPITITLTAVPGYSSKVTLHCEGMHSMDSCQFASTTLSLSPAAPATTTVKLVIGKGSYWAGSPESFTVVADDGNVIKRQSIQVALGNLLLWYSGAEIDAASPGTGDADLTIWNFGIPPYTPSCSGLPKGATCTFKVGQLPYPSSNDLQLIVTAPTGLAAGKYPFQITVTSGSESSSVAANLAITAAAPAPTFAPPQGTYTGTQQVAMNDTNLYATIFYTLDGSTPSGFSTQYKWNTPISISKTTTVKAIAWVNGMGISPVSTATYTIK
ncbi:MAG: FG-GAP-like repeat-containing protein [Terracidiphilus sp.]